MYTLVLNHMQPRIFSTVEAIVPQVIREIRRAIASGGSIVVLEIEPHPESHGPTDKRIMSVLRAEAQGRFTVMAGWSHDSADLVQLAVQSLKFPADTVRVVGVATDSCVFSLVLGLSALGFARIEVIKDACNCRSSPDDDAWKRYNELSSVVLLPTSISCPYCNTWQSSDSNLCDRCGRQINRELLGLLNLDNLLQEEKPQSR